VLRAALNNSAAATDPDFRNGLLAALVRREDITVLPQLQAELFSAGEGKRLNSRGNLIFALQFIDGKTSVPILARALKLPDGELRQDAARAMQNTGSADPQQAIDALLSALDDPDRDVQFSVMQSLGYLNRETYWRPHTTNPKEDFGNPYWNECLNHWRQFAISRHPAGVAQP
jgi:HEAT repeat protein